MTLRPLLVLYFQVSYLCINYVEAQYPTMYNMQGLPEMQPMPQIFTYPTQMQETEYYEPHHHNHNIHQHMYRTKHKSKRKKTHARHEVSNSQEEEYAQSYNSEECRIYSCDQCTAKTSAGCQPFCEACQTSQVNQEILFVPYPYPYLVNIPPNEQNPQSSETTHKEENNTPNSNVEIETTTIQPTDSTIQPTDSTTENKTTKTTEKPREETTRPLPNTTRPVPLKLVEERKAKYIFDNNCIQKNKKKCIKNRIKTIDLTSSELTDQNKSLMWNSLKEIMSEKSLLETDKNYVKSKDYDDIILKLPDQDSSYVITSMKQLKQGLAPKYRIVPIPDNMASDLMSKLRTTKLLQPDRETKAIRYHRKVLTQSLTDAVNRLTQPDLPYELVNKIYRN